MAESFQSNPNMSTPVAYQQQQPKVPAAEAKAPAETGTVDMTNTGDGETPSSVQQQEGAEEQKYKKLDTGVDGYTLSTSYINNYLSPWLGKSRDEGFTTNGDSDVTYKLTNVFMDQDALKESFKMEYLSQKRTTKAFTKSNDLIKQELAIESEDKKSQYQTEEFEYRVVNRHPVFGNGIIRYPKLEDGSIDYTKGVLATEEQLNALGS